MVKNNSLGNVPLLPTFIYVQYIRVLTSKHIQQRTSICYKYLEARIVGCRVWQQAMHHCKCTDLSTNLKDKAFINKLEWAPSLRYQKEKTFSFICVVVEVCCFKIIQLIKFQFHSIRKFAPLKSLQCITFGQLLVTTLFEMMMPKAVDARKGNDGRLLDLLVSMSLSGG